MKVVNLVLELLVYLSFMWGTLRFFRKTKNDNRQLGIAAILIFGTSNVVLSLYFTYLGNSDSILSAVLFAVSLVLFWTAVRSNRKNPLAYAFSELSSSQVVTQGPYKFIRHPFYVSYSLAWVGAILCTHSILIMTLSALLIFIYIRAAFGEEALFLSGPMALDYRDYMTKTGRFIPKILKGNKR